MALLGSLQSHAESFQHSNRSFSFETLANVALQPVIRAKTVRELSRNRAETLLKEKDDGLPAFSDILAEQQRIELIAADQLVEQDEHEYVTCIARRVALTRQSAQKRRAAVTGVCLEVFASCDGRVHTEADILAPNVYAHDHDLCGDFANRQKIENRPASQPTFNVACAASPPLFTFSAAEEAVNTSSMDTTLSRKSKQEKHECHDVVAGAMERGKWHFGGKNCKCPPEHVVAGKSWECGDALGQRHFSSKMAISSCVCMPTSPCEDMAAGAKKRNSASKNPDRPCKCEKMDEVLEGTARQCSAYLGERYFPNTLPPQECSCRPNVLVKYKCDEIALGATEVEKDRRVQCKCPEDQFLNGEDQQCKDFHGAHFFPNRLKPGLCSCSVNGRGPHSSSKGLGLGLASLLILAASLAW
ncbi:pak1ip1 [Symbiodinium pilosum]|uniref:Pak1ip1 protein n=1 Tax=Symbiodinium pilosum TaxID=2952 RepID=A0A812U8J2_SYMPI|nr:pak1ip1 [Symbiodinium pilosum]